MVFIRRPSLLNSAQIQTRISDEGLNPNAQETISVLSFAQNSDGIRHEMKRSTIQTDRIHLHYEEDSVSSYVTESKNHSSFKIRYYFSSMLVLAHLPAHKKCWHPRSQYFLFSASSQRRPYLHVIDSSFIPAFNLAMDLHLSLQPPRAGSVDVPHELSEQC